MTYTHTHTHCAWSAIQHSPSELRKTCIKCCESEKEFRGEYFAPFKDVKVILDEFAWSAGERALLMSLMS